MMFRAISNRRTTGSQGAIIGHPSAILPSCASPNAQGFRPTAHVPTHNAVPTHNRVHVAMGMYPSPGNSSQCPNSPRGVIINGPRLEVPKPGTIAKISPNVYMSTSSNSRSPSMLPSTNQSLHSSTANVLTGQGHRPVNSSQHHGPRYWDAQSYSHFWRRYRYIHASVKIGYSPTVVSGFLCIVVKTLAGIKFP